MVLMHIKIWEAFFKERGLRMRLIIGMEWGCIRQESFLKLTPWSYVCLSVCVSALVCAHTHSCENKQRNTRSWFAWNSWAKQNALSSIYMCILFIHSSIHSHTTHIFTCVPWRTFICRHTITGIPAQSPACTSSCVFTHTCRPGVTMMVPC